MLYKDFQEKDQINSMVSLSIFITESYTYAQTHMLHTLKVGSSSSAN